MGAPHEWWNVFVYRAVIKVHQILGMDPSDLTTTWKGKGYEPLVDSSHEAYANNKWHLLAFTMVPLCWLRSRHRSTSWSWYYAGIGIAFVLFCALPRWQPWHSRLHLALFVLGSALIGTVAGTSLPVQWQAGLATFLLCSAYPYLFENC